ncbi:unnamed protein product [Caenorhabditis auriculariae]|uniref:Uncharacterized protein n=1 Tax=Caenorhabditis auriculariae TaxID=2777116 RepID=A0A8S1H8N9_9PELO|nr:unnamed protein product [Caenorhabditis auriculariae]
MTILRSQPLERSLIQMVENSGATAITSQLYSRRHFRRANQTGLTFLPILIYWIINGHSVSRVFGVQFNEKDGLQLSRISELPLDRVHLPRFSLGYVAMLLTYLLRYLDDPSSLSTFYCLLVPFIDRSVDHTFSRRSYAIGHPVLSSWLTGILAKKFHPWC